MELEYEIFYLCYYEYRNQHIFLTYFIYICGLGRRSASSPSYFPSMTIKCTYIKQDPLCIFIISSNNKIAVNYVVDGNLWVHIVNYNCVFFVELYKRSVIKVTKYVYGNSFTGSKVNKLSDVDNLKNFMISQIV